MAAKILSLNIPLYVSSHKIASKKAEKKIKSLLASFAVAVIRSAVECLYTLALHTGVKLYKIAAGRAMASWHPPKARHRPNVLSALSKETPINYGSHVSE